MKTKLFPLLFAVLCLLTITSCGDDKEDSVSPNIKRLTVNDWIGNAVFVDNVDRTADFKQQSGLDITKYKSTFTQEGNYEDFYDGSSIVKGTWEYANDERVIIFDKGKNDEYSVVISKLDDNALWYQQAGVEYRFVKMQ